MSGGAFSGYLPSFGFTLGMGDSKALFKALQQLNFYMSLPAGNSGSRWEVQKAQFYGFDNHTFDYNRLTGLFYIPGSQDVINPIAVLSGELNWFSILSHKTQLDRLIIPEYVNTTPYDPPFPADNTIEALLIPIPPLFKAIRGAQMAKTGARTLGANPFRGKSFRQIDKMFKAKGYTAKGPSPMTGRGSYFNPNSGTRYYLDQGGMYRKGFERPHVDIWYNGHPTYEKVKYFLDDLSKLYTTLK
jgi:hypothetical protein